MTAIPIFNTMRLGVTLQPTGYPELTQFGAHVALREPELYESLFDVWDTFIGSLSGLQAPCTIQRYTISTWGTGPGFTGWHQVAARDVAISAGGGDMLPHQLTLVAGYRNITEVTIALGRRRNRLNVGPLRSATMDTSGRSTTSTNSTLSDDMSNFHDALQGVEAEVSIPLDCLGLVVVSPAEEAGMNAEQATIGRRYDILRSRAEKTPESTTLRTLEVV
jgi:hypothetical protein